MLTLKPTLALGAIKTCMAAGDPIFLHGQPGVGKTSLIHEAGQRAQMGVTVSRLALMEPVDLTGVPFVVNDRLIFAKPTFFPKEGDAPSIWFFDEWLQGTTACQNAAGQLLNERRLGDYKLPDNVYICAASNRLTDRAGTNRMPSHIADRFTHIEIEVSVDDWIKWALAAGLETEVIAFIKFRPELLAAFDAKATVSPSPRSWEKVSMLRRANPATTVEHALYAGRVGEGAAAEFMGFLRVFRSLPDPDAVLMNPDTAKVPPEDAPATLYALTGVLARKATTSNMDRVVRYANRLPEEFSVVLVKQAVERDAELTQTRPFIQWAADHQSALC